MTDLPTDRDDDEPPDDEPTVAEAPAAKRLGATGSGVSARGTRSGESTREGTSSASQYTSLTTSGTGELSFADALRKSEISRMRRFVPLTTGMGVVLAALLPLIDGDPAVKKLVWIGIAAAIAAVTYVYSLTYNIEKYTEGRLGAAYAVCVAALYTAVYFFGVFSAASAVIALGIFFVGIGRSGRIALMLYGLVALTQGTLAVLIVSGTVPDLGLVRADDLPVMQQVLTQAALQLVFLVTYLVARATRQQLDAAVSEHDNAVRAVAKREMLLDEARRELDRALQVGGPGRYSEQRMGSFTLGDLIGRGAMGEVYEAVHRETGEAAAVKLLPLSSLGQKGHLTRFLREATAAASIESPNVVRLLEVSDADSPLPYIAMERLYGNDLSHFLRQKNALSVDAIVDMVGQVARGLEAARSVGIVHRDIKPQNLFLSTADGDVWKVLDFGVSKLDDSHGTLTKGSVVGTPMYMAPEQAQGEAVDHRADVYALAAVAYRALTGQPPYSGKDMPSILYDVVYKMPQRPSEASSLVLPRDIDRALMIGLAKSPDDRYETGLELAEALGRAARSKLDRATRQRSAKLAKTHPWGERIRD